jgi:hypothetical protein
MKKRSLGLAVALAICLLAAALAPPARAGFSGTDVFIASIARKAGVSPSQFYSTVWITNLSESEAAHVTYRFYAQGQSNANPLTKSETLQAGETKRYENAVETLLGLSDAAGALRISSDQPILASSRTYDQPPGTDISFVKGLFFPAIPIDFAIGIGDVARLQGVIGSAENYRYNFGFVEVSGSSAKIRTTLRGPAGAELGTLEETIAANGAFQHRVTDVAPSFTGNGRLESTVISGSGKVLLFGTLIANGSSDSAGFEMSFKDGLLASRAETSSQSLSASASTTADWAAHKAYELAPLLGVAGGRRSALAQQFTSSYDAATGFWTVSVALDTGQSATLLIQFRDGQGQTQKLFNLQTASIVLKGQAAGTQGYLQLDLTLTDIRAGSTAFAVNGTGNATYQGTSGTIAVSNLTIPKVLPPYPTSGTIVATVNGIAITLTFNGTQYAQGTYEIRNQTIHFTVNLKTGEVTQGT